MHNQQRLLLRPPQSNNAYDPKMLFISFDLPHRKPPEPFDLPTYRDISQPETEDTGLMEADLQGLSTVEQETRSRTIAAEQHLKQHPEDFDCWIAYSTLHLGNSDTRAVGSDPAQIPTTRAAAEVTLSILSRALSAAPENSVSTPLHIAYIHAAEAVWPPEQITERWKNVLRVLGEAMRNGAKNMQDGMMGVWLAYLEWREGQGFGKSEEGKAGGGVDEVVEVYAECLRAAGTSSSMQAKEENQLYIFLRACLFLKQAGRLDFARREPS